MRCGGEIGRRRRRKGGNLLKVGGGAKPQPALLACPPGNLLEVSAKCLYSQRPSATGSGGSSCQQPRISATDRARQARVLPEA